MSSGLLWSNLIAYSLQIGLLVGVAAVAPGGAAAAVAAREAGVLAHAAGGLSAAAAGAAVAPAGRSPTPFRSRPRSSRSRRRRSPPDAHDPAHRDRAARSSRSARSADWAGCSSASGNCRRYRRHSQPLSMRLPWPSRAELRIADDIASPVTFGARSSGGAAAAAISRSRRVARRTRSCATSCCMWSGATGCSRSPKRLVRAIFWFHPAIWWLLGEIQLAREQAVDREVIEMTQAQDEYVDALLAIAGAQAAARSGARAAVPAQTAFETTGSFDFEGGSYVEDETDFRTGRVHVRPGGGLLVRDEHVPARRGSAGGKRFARRVGRYRRRRAAAPRPRRVSRVRAHEAHPGQRGGRVDLRRRRQRRRCARSERTRRAAPAGAAIRAAMALRA